jgi:hypothetical protein
MTPLIEHWNGTTWAVSPTPNLTSGQSGNVFDLNTSSSADAWAVGSQAASGNPFNLLTEHWDGKSWTQVPAPLPAGADAAQAEGVADISPTNAWMVGTSNASDSTTGPGWIEHWDGKAWTDTPVAGMPAISDLWAVRGLSATNVWAVGDVLNAGAQAESPLILHYDGTSWTIQSGIPSPAVGSSHLLSVAVTSTGAMAVGQTTISRDAQPLVLLWNGTTWAQLPVPNPGTSAFLSGVGGTSDNYWAVGESDTSTGANPLALHCC